MKGLIDTTLREGEQGVGVYFSDRQRLYIFENVCHCGIEEVEIGVCAPRNRRLVALFSECRQLAGEMRRPPRLAIWSRCRPEDIALAAKLQPDVLSLCIPASDLHLRKRLRTNRKKLLELVACTLKEIRDRFAYISVGIEDASRADPHFLKELLHIAGEFGADRIRLADTVGVLSPTGTQILVKLARKAFPGEIAVHCHNDFGMATANTIAALESGAAWGDATLLGMGERAGNARLEEVAAYLKLNATGRTAHQGYDLKAIKELCLDITAMTGQEIAENKAIVGAGLFSCESGLHTAAIEQSPATYEPFAPETVGASRQLFYGAKTGHRALAGKMKTLGCLLSAPSLDRLVDTVRNISAERGRPFGDRELEQLAAGLGGSQNSG